MLKQKSIENLKMAEIAKQNNCYNVAASRYYYSLFQQMKSYLISNKISFNVDGASTHINVICYFVADVKSKLSNKNSAKFQSSLSRSIYRLKNFREKADYDESIEINLTDINMIKNSYDIVINGLTSEKIF